MPILTVGSRRVLYIHVPKTGGTSVERLLSSYGEVTLRADSSLGLACTPQHFHSAVLRGMFEHANRPDSHEFHTVFMTVRDPYERLLSEYRHQRSTNRPLPRGAGRLERLGVRLVTSARVLSFDLWARHALALARRDPFYADNHLRPQAEFSLWNATFFRLEDGLDAVRVFLDSTLGGGGILPTNPEMRAGDRSGSIDDLRPATRRLIEDFYSTDFRSFGYESRL